MEIPILILGPSDIDSVDELMKQNKTLGFLPFAALRDHLGSGTVLGAKDDDGSLAGYLLYASNPQRFRIAHLCISDKFRGTGLARRLFEALKGKCTTQSVIRLNCRRDYDAQKVWPRLGFIPVDEKPGRSQEGHPLTRWEYRVSEDNQLDLFRERASDQALEVVIDAQILFHFDAPMSHESRLSKALLADFLADQIFIRLTDEIFLEIDRHPNPQIRDSSRSLAHSYPLAIHDHKRAEFYEGELTSLLAPKNDSDVSDIRHLAKTAASDVDIFVTRDEEILRRSAEIARITQLEIVGPVDLIVRLHELLEKKSYGRIPVSGQEIAWRRAQADDSRKLVDALRLPGEVKSRIRETLQQFLADPVTCKLDILWRGDQILGARASTERDNCLTISFVRAAQLDDQRLVEGFLVSDAVATCVATDMQAIRLKGAGLPDSLELELSSMGFQKIGSDYGRLCLTGTLAREEIDEEADRHFPELKKTWRSASDREILTRCSPVAIQNFQESCFVVPIRPGYAMSLFDKQSASGDLFGGRAHILMRWENVYYRSNSHHKMLTAPARVLWYESREVGAITAVSHLQAVEIESPKALFQKFRKLGTLDWEDVYKMCKGDVTRKIMALKFSHTFAFRRPVPLDALREMEGRQSVPVQSPRSIDNGLFHRILKAGFPRH